jgi:hypothetical protein
MKKWLLRGIQWCDVCCNKFLIYHLNEIIRGL